MFNEGDIIDDKYEVIINGFIGNGGFGEVIEVKSIANDTHYALKYCKSQLDEDIRRFKREIRMMEQIDHENVIEIIDFNHECKVPYFIMPLATTSGDKMMLKTKSNLDATIEVFSSICKGTIAIHNSNLTHRDIKPANVLFFSNDGNSKIVVSDLGLSKFDTRDSTPLTMLHAGGGSQAYAPPENYTKGEFAQANHLGDVYMVALTLYAFYAGKDPAPGGSIESGVLPERLETIITKATAHNPEKRYQSVAKLLDEVNDFYLFTKSVNKQDNYLMLIDKIAKTLNYNNTFSKSDIEAAIYYLLELKDDLNFIDLFNRIPLNQLNIMASMQNDNFNSLVELYCDKNNEMIGGQPFPYADMVGQKLEIIFSEVKSKPIKVIVLKSILITGNALNRFAVMELFDKLLVSVKDDSLGLDIAEMLKDEPQYKFAYERLQKEHLPLSIRSAWEAADRKDDMDDSGENNIFTNFLLNN